MGDDLDQMLVEVKSHCHAMATIAARHGCRLAKLFFTLDNLDVSDPDNAQLKLREGKDGDDHAIPPPFDDAAKLATRLGRACAAKLLAVWFRERR